MTWRKKKEIFQGMGFIFLGLASIPTLSWAIKSVISGKYGDSINNFKGQPIHPIMVLIVFGVLVITLPIIYYKNKDKK